MLYIQGQIVKLFANLQVGQSIVWPAAGCLSTTVSGKELQLSASAPLAEITTGNGKPKSWRGELERTLHRCLKQEEREKSHLVWRDLLHSFELYYLHVMLGIGFSMTRYAQQIAHNHI